MTLPGGSASLAREPSAAGPGGPAYTLLQMNLCLSGFARCYGKVAYPAGVRDAAAVMAETHPDAVTVNEACRGDVARIARRTGYHLAFSTVTVSGEPLSCVRPGGRGVFGDAVLTRVAIERADSRDFHAQAGPEWRRWLCAATRSGVDVCTAHLAGRAGGGAAANDAQCAELRALLRRRAATRTVVFGGDLNRRARCASGRAWARTDGLAHQAPGLQWAYGSAALRSPSARVQPAAHTDHDVLLVRAHLSAARSSGVAASGETSRRASRSRQG